MLGLFALIGLHLIAALFIPSPWFVPNFSVVGLVLAVSHKPSSWFAFALLCGLLSALWVIRSPVPVMMSYVAIGWVVQMLGSQVDVRRLDFQYLMVGISTLIVTLSGLWLSGIYSFPLLALIILNVIISSLSVFP